MFVILYHLAPHLDIWKEQKDLYPHAILKKSDGDIVSAPIRPSVRPSRYLLLNHWAEFYQTCYTTSPNGKGVQEQHYFSVRSSVYASVVRPFVCPNLDITSPHD